MLRPTLVLLALSFALPALSQNVGINATGTAPSASALLDIDAAGMVTKGGVLIPRLTTAERNAIATPATSLLIFNTTAARFEYFDGLAWVPLASIDWALTGNAGTNPATQFIGTTDAQPLAFRTNGTERMRIQAGATTSVGINTTTPSSTLHVLFTLPNNINSAVQVETNQATSATNIGFRNSASVNFCSLGMLSNGDFGLGIGCNFGGCGLGTEAFRVKPNGNFGIGTINALDRLHVVGSIRMVDGNQAANRVMVSDANGTASWQVLGAATTNAWGLLGNAGTTAATNFIGTTDAQALRFRTANQLAGNLPVVASQFVSYGLLAGLNNTGVGNTYVGNSAGVANTTGGSNTFVGNNAGAANVASGNNTYVGTSAGAANVNGQQNVYIGRLAGGNGISGSDNILIGNGAGIGNTANNNVMIGSFSGNGNSTGGGNTFLGTQSGASTSTGGQNTFIGTGAGSSNTIGTQNTLIGNGASVNANNLTNATAIGRASRVDASDALVLGSVTGINAATTTSRVGIGTTNPLDRLHVAGSIRMVDGNQALNRVMVSDANGTGSWVDPLVVASNLTWTLTGNTGTNPVTNFLGTSDNVNLTLRTNNVIRARVTNTGLFEVGGAPVPALFSTGTAKFLVASEIVGQENATIWAAHNAPTGRASLSLARQRGSLSVFNPVIDGDGLGEVVFDGYSTGSTVAAASIHSDVDGLPTSNSVPGKLGFSTTPVGSSAPIERVTIRSNGNVGIGTTTPLTTVDMLGALSIRDDGNVVQVVGDNQLITVGNRGYIRLGSNSAASPSRTITLSDGLVRGQLLLIEEVSIGGIEVDDNSATNNTNVSSVRPLFIGDTIMLVWNGTDWVELTWSNN